MQHFAVELLLVRDERLRSEDFAQRFKLAVVSHDPQRWIFRMFPQWEAAQEPVRAEEFDDALVDADEVVYEFEDEEWTQEMIDEALDAGLAERSGTGGLSEIDTWDQ